MIIHVHDFCSYALMYCIPIALIFAIIILGYAWINRDTFDKHVESWKSTLIADVCFGLVAEIFSWLYQLGLVSFMLALLALVIEALFLIDFLHNLPSAIDDQIFIWVVRISIVFTILTAVMIVVYCFAVITLINF